MSSRRLSLVRARRASSESPRLLRPSFPPLSPFPPERSGHRGGMSRTRKARYSHPRPAAQRWKRIRADGLNEVVEESAGGERDAGPRTLGSTAVPRKRRQARAPGTETIRESRIPHSNIGVDRKAQGKRILEAEYRSDSDRQLKRASGWDMKPVSTHQSSRETTRDR